MRKIDNREQALRKIELPSEALAKELQRHLQEKRFAVHGRAYDALQFPDDMKPSEWAGVRGTVEKWASGRQLRVVESLRLQTVKGEAKQEKVNPKVLEAEVNRRLETLTPSKAEERYNYLQSRPISELTDAEYDERLALAQRISDKVKDSK